MLRLADEKEKADILMNQLRRAAPDEPSALLAVNRYYRETGRPAEARTDIERAELVRLLHQSLRELDEPTRLLLLGSTMEGLSYKELSARYDKPMGTVCSALARGLTRVRPQLLDWLDQRSRQPHQPQQPA